MVCASAELVLSANLVEAIGYVKASNTEDNDEFGLNLALSGDGGTLAVGATDEDSVTTGIGGDQSDNSASFAGSVYIY